MAKEQMILWVSALLMISVIGTICLLTVTMKFDGEKETSDDSFHVAYEYLNKTLTHYMTFEKGEKISVKGINLDGELTLSIDDMRGKNIYKKREMTRENLIIDVPKSGKYVISVVGVGAEGSVSFIRLEKNEKF